MKHNLQKIEVKYNGTIYGEYGILREDFVRLLRELRLDVVEDVNIKESDFGANPKAVEEYARKRKMLFVTLSVNDVPFYFCVRGNMAEEKIRGWFTEVLEVDV